MKNIFYILLFIFIGQCRSNENNTITQLSGKSEVPSSIKQTHLHLLEQVHKMTFYEDSSSYIALKLENLMQHHFKEEEDFILPPLGLLPLLEGDKIPQNISEIINSSKNVRSQMDHMSAEHQLISAYIEELKQVSDTDNLPEINGFENEIIHHAKSEEEIFYPTAILIGEYLKLRSALKK